MCVIAICNSKRIKKAEFFESFRCNSDGCGMAWSTKNNNKYVKGIMKVEEAWEQYNQLIPEKHFPHIVHFRIGAPVIPELTHPFIISEESELLLNYEGKNTLLFHNGVISNWKQYLLPTFMSIRNIPEGAWSDTRMVAIILNMIGEKALGYIDGKFVTFNNNDISITGTWEKEDDGITWSNVSYKPVIRAMHKYDVNTWRNQDMFKTRFEEETTKENQDTLEHKASILDYGHFDNIQELGKSLEFIV